jgi:cytoskeletal protein RodZ
MIKIVLDRKKLKKEFEELEKDYSQGNLSKKEYFARKRDIGQEMETLQVAEHVRRMQGRMGSEKSLDYWSDQEEDKKKLADEAEKQELFKKYITNPDSIKDKDIPSRKWFGKRAKIGLVAFIILAFVVGTSMGSLLINQPSETPSVAMMVNASAFLPTAANNTTTTSNATISTKNTQTTTTTTESTPTTTTTESTPTTTTTESTPTTDTNIGNTENTQTSVSDKG